MHPSRKCQPRGGGKGGAGGPFINLFNSLITKKVITVMAQSKRSYFYDLTSCRAGLFGTDLCARFDCDSQKAIKINEVFVIDLGA